VSKLFEIQRKLFSDIVGLACGCLEKTINPNDPSQYLIIKTKDKVLELIFSNIQAIIVVRLDEASDSLKVFSDGVHVVKGDILNSMLHRIDVMDKVTVSVDKDGLDITFPNLLADKEEWQIPCLDPASLDLSTNPKIEMGEEHQFRIEAKKWTTWLNRVGMAVGKDAGNPIYRNILIRVKGDQVDFVTSSIGHLAWAKEKCDSATGDFFFVTPHEQLVSLSKLLDHERPVVVIHNQSDPGTVVMVQEVQYGEKPVGKVFFRTSCASEPFVKFEATIKTLRDQLKNQCKVKVQHFVNICHRLALLEPPETKVIWDKEKEALVFSKQEAGRGATKGIALPASEMEGKERFEIVLSSRHLKMIADKADADKGAEILWMFGEPTQFTCIHLSPQLETYFSPFKE